MGKSRGALRIVPDRCYSTAVARTRDAADSSTEPVLAGIEAALTMAEHDPAGARAALWRLQTDWQTLGEVEERLGYEPTQAALRIGAAIQAARSVLASSPAPQLRGRLPEVIEWLRPRELSAVE